MKLMAIRMVGVLVLGLFVGCGDSSSDAESDTSASGPSNSGTESGAVAAFEEANRIRAGRQEEAIALYTKAIEADPEFAEAYHNRGLSYAELYDFKNAESDLAKVKELGLDSSKLEEAIAIAKQLKKMSE